MTRMIARRFAHYLGLNVGIATILGSALVSAHYYAESQTDPTAQRCVPADSPAATSPFNVAPICR